MNRFLTVLAAVALAGAIYVAAAPGSQTAGPTARQFKALQREVTGLKKETNGLKKELRAVEFVTLVDTTVLSDCMQHAHPIDEFGDPTNGTFGYTYQDPNINSGNPYKRSALDFADPADPNALWITNGGSTCGTDINGPALRKVALFAGVHLHSAPHASGAARH